MELTKSLLHTTDTYVKKLHEVGILTVEDFIRIFPKDLEDKSTLMTRFVELAITEKQAVRCRIELLTKEVTRNKKILIKAVLTDSDGSHAEAVWFNRKFLLQKFASWDEVIIYGQPRYEYGRLSFPSAEIEFFREKRQELFPIYSDLNYIPDNWIREKMPLFRQAIRQIPDEIPREIREKRNMRTFAENVESLHFPSSEADFERAKSEIGYTELFRFQKIGLEKKYLGRKNSLGKSPETAIDTDLMKDLIASLPFELTDKQKIVIFQILKDMESHHAMSRMLQGDVWTGKTVVAMLIIAHASIIAKRNGKSLQSAIMAPTEILARQHFLGQTEWLEKWNLRSDLLVGSLTKKQKEQAVARLKNGDTDIIFGTHALIQDSVAFESLGIVIVDEQHRFGVEQRKTLEEYVSVRKNPEGIVPHVLNMSATPIPRSLALTLYGDQDISVLNEYPKWRKPIHTKVIKEHERTEIYRFIEEEVRQWRQVYWISPLVEESETLDIANATSMQAFLQETFPHLNVWLIHGKMSGREKDQIMQEFYDNTIHVLSSTSVVEVGVNNPNATIICIEASERFGLSQLHQFRGRVGRGEHQSYCYLFTTKEYKNERLCAMEKTNDGFELAEIDLELRGPWEVYGVRQSGLPDMHFADLKDLDLIAEVREDIENHMKNAS